jgi:hypothetical protein
MSTKAKQAFEEWLKLPGACEARPDYWMAGYDYAWSALASVLAECGTHHTCTDSCGVCELHFDECEHDLFAIALDAADEKLEIPKGRGYACPGAKARALLEGGH